MNTKSMDSREIYKVLGLMSGTSLDGLDVAFCIFEREDTHWRFAIEKAMTIPYSSKWKNKLSHAHHLRAEELIALDIAYGKYLGEACDKFIRQHKRKPDFIASHGHTIFHQPKKGFTFQLGNGNAIHAAAALPVVNDFRSLDVLLGGQGAPLVPAGDKILFSEFEVCLNIGGIANLSYDVNGKRIAFDICFANMGLNYLANKANKTYDKGGAMAADGTVHEGLLSKLERAYHKLRNKRPSLGRELFEQAFKPLLDNEKIPVQDRLRTLTVSTAIEIVKSFPSGKTSVLCTGGGAFNSFLIYNIIDRCSDQTSIIIPEDDVVKFKEALVFAFLGVLAVRGENYCLRSVTGASRDSCGGQLTGFLMSQ